MDDRIKEILDRLDYDEWKVDLYKVPITWSEMYDIRYYITNLIQENEELRKNQRFHKKFGDDYIFCLEGDKETYKDMIFMYQERIEKAIEYINKHFEDDEGIICKNTGENECEINYNFLNDLLSILKNERNKESNNENSK